MVRLLLPQAGRAGPLHEPDPHHGRRAELGAGARGGGHRLRARPRHRRRDDAREPPGAGAGDRRRAGGRRPAGCGRPDLHADRARQHPQRVRASVQRSARRRADRHAPAVPRRDGAVHRQPRLRGPAAQVQHLPQRRRRAFAPLLDAGPQLPRLPLGPRHLLPGARGRQPGPEPAPGLAPAGAGAAGPGGGRHARAARPVPPRGLAREAPPGALALPGRADRRRRGAGGAGRARADPDLAGPEGPGPGDPLRRPGRLVPAARPPACGRWGCACRSDG